MKADRPRWEIVAAFALAVAPLLGCARTQTAEKQDEGKESAEQEEYKEDARGVADEAEDKAREAGQELEKAGEKIGDKAAATAEKVGDKASEAMGQLGEKVDAAKQKLDVKAALMAEKDLDASGIDVDISEETKTLTLKGSVPTAAQKATAGRIAKQKADGYTVKNQLTVSARTGSTR